MKRRSQSKNTLVHKVRRFGEVLCRPSGRPQKADLFKEPGLVNIKNRPENCRPLYVLMRTASMNRLFFTLHIVVGYMALVSTSLGNTNSALPSDLVAFYKQAISSPFDVEEFTAGLRTLSELPEVNGHVLSAPDKNRANAIQFWGGARAGTNYFIGKISNLNSPAPEVLISGRAGSTNYRFNRNSVTYMMGTNAMSKFNGALFKLTRQFLNMGLGDIDPPTVVWTGDEFSAMDDNGAPRYGSLALSENLPRTLTIRDGKNSAPLKTIQYTYPNPPSSGGGFPSKMVLTARSEGGLKPAVELILHHVRLAPAPLAKEFFADNKFKGTSIVHSMVFSNDVAFASDRKGKMIRLPDAFINPREPTRHSRILIYGFFAIVGILPLVIFGWFRKSRMSIHNK